MQIIKTFLLFVIVCVGLLLVALFPREPEIRAEGRAQTVKVVYEFSWTKYKENLSGFFSHLINEKSLGDTRYKKPVEQEVFVYFTRSLKIIVTAFILSLFVGILKGIFDFQNSHTKRNFLGNGTTWVLQSIPDFLLILFIMWFIILNFRGLNIMGHDAWYNFIFPAFLVSIYPAMYISRITSAAILGEVGQQYIQVAKAKGLTKKIVLYKHVLRNCMSTILSNVPTMTIFILSNLLFVEYLLDYRGAAYRLFQAIDFRRTILVGRAEFNLYEPSVIIAYGIGFMIIVLFVQLGSQLISRKLDPR
ncbi:ABC transporter permease subunit [Fredinandcohnia humi]